MSFLDNLKQTLKDVANKTGEVANDVKETAKLKMDITAKKRAIEASYITLGKKVFEDYEAGSLTDESFGIEVEAIKKNQDEILRLEEVLAQITPIGEHIKEGTTAAAALFKESAHSAQSFMSEKADDVKEFVKEKKEELAEKKDELKAEKDIEEVKDDVKETWNDVVDETKDKWEDVKDKAEEVVDKAEDKVDELNL